MKDCIFCKIIENNIPSVTIYEDEVCRVIMDKFPSSVGHMLVMPKKHYKDIYEIDNNDLSHMIKVVKIYASKLKDVLGCDGINILQNNGEASGQTVFHFHIHIIPRYKDDDVVIRWNSNEEEDEKLGKLKDKLKG